MLENRLKELTKGVVNLSELQEKLGFKNSEDTVKCALKLMYDLYLAQEKGHKIIDTMADGDVLSNYFEVDLKKISKQYYELFCEK